jgi:hypothetical protein
MVLINRLIKQSVILKRKCSFIHNYKLKRKITPYLREIECKNCNRQFGMHDELRCILPLDDELHTCNDDLIKLYDT